ncbi:hypothetical protein ASH01_17080 [Terrabacter sp. Soil811]|uniref:DNA cytosine methyltransferase n=1 Tax=Terrabacter sp. Soil811 TaxID=1736419 RepID=UPI0006F334AA|nr:DNA cytosine methyltransferase [Terrabacter sp. Soil811]KRF42536.1 hypothetical protein ASH01_17080 [Terrabacter sp. Soil811]
MIPVVDVFAGPGGLNEGFAHLRRDDKAVFEVVSSFEMEPNAVETLVMREAVREVSRRDGGGLYAPYKAMLAGRLQLGQLLDDDVFAAAVARARQHVHRVELGPGNRAAVADRIESATAHAKEWVLIGGPPCQAYSLVGRARRTNDQSFAQDKKHFLYREYLDILKRFKPSVFVMENVKGLLSAGHGGRSMIDRILDDLGLDGTYEVRSLVVQGRDLAPRDFVIRAEAYGVPQRRHRVILLGVRADLGAVPATSLRLSETPVTVHDAIGDLPHRRSRVSRTKDSDIAWIRARELARHLAVRDLGEACRREPVRAGNPELENWLKGRGAPISQHDARSHMELDLARYAFLATLAEHGIAPKVADLPVELKPHHKNIDVAGTPFIDRFKVQRWSLPSSTVASHISKDGHYYIHPDPDQMRSLTVREAARLQTFPDDYWFYGTRTMQFHQVGNAVPPLLAHKIADKVAELLGQ